MVLGRAKGELDAALFAEILQPLPLKCDLKLLSDL